MDSEIRNELKAKLEIGENYYYGSTFNGGGYDWDNMEMFDESIRMEVECWIENTATCGFKTDVNLCRVSDNELEFTIYATQVSPMWYPEDVKLYNDTLFDAAGLEISFGKLYEDIFWSFEYEYTAEEGSSLQLPENFRMYGIHNESGEDIDIKLNKLPPDFKERLTKAMDSFVEKLEAPDDFTTASVRITSDYCDEHCNVEERWVQTFKIKL